MFDLDYFLGGDPADSIFDEYTEDPAVARDIVRLTLPTALPGKLASVNEDGSMILAEDGRPILIRGIDNTKEVNPWMALRTYIEDVLSYAEQLDVMDKQHGREREEQCAARLHPIRADTGRQKDRILTPVLTVVMFWNNGEWDGPMGIQDLMRREPGVPKDAGGSNRLLLVEPSKLTEEQVDACTSSLRAVLRFIRASDDPEALRRLVAEDPAYRAIGVLEAHVIREATDVHMVLPEDYDREDTIDLREAISAAQQEQADGDAR